MPLARAAAVAHGLAQAGDRVRRHGRRAVRCAGHAPTFSRSRQCEAHVPRHRHQLRRAADRMRVQRVPVARPARQAHARRRRRRDGHGTRLLIDTPPELRAPADCERHRPRRCGALHPRSRRPHARSRRHSRDIGAARCAAADVRTGERHWRASLGSFRTSSMNRCVRCPARRNRRDARSRSTAGEAVRIGDATVLPLARAARACHRLRLPHRAAGLRHRCQADPGGGAAPHCPARRCSC